MIKLGIPCEISDDSGFMAIVNPDKYRSFVNEDWEFNELKERFIQEMNNNSLVIWATGMENTWNVRFLDHPSDVNAFRQFETRIDVTGEKLVLTNYEDLTMAAQFKDSVIPSEHNAGLFIKLANGKYKCIVRQMLDPNNFDDDLIDDDDTVQFEIILSLANDSELIKESPTDIYWND